MSRQFDRIAPVLLALLFVAITLPGLSWGVPSYWHPDELARNVDKMIHGVYRIDATFFNHPFLPKHIYAWIGRLVMQFGDSRQAYILLVRFLNLVLAGGIIGMAYLVTRASGAGILAGVWAAAFTFSSSEISLNARIAHDDIFVAFFTTLAVFLLVKYRSSKRTLFLFASFFVIGLAASSKYNGVSLALAPVVLVLLERRNSNGKSFINKIVTLLAGLALVILGFLAGSPEALTQLSFFLQQIKPACCIMPSSTASQTA